MRKFIALGSDFASAPLVLSYDPSCIELQVSVSSFDQYTKFLSIFLTFFCPSLKESMLSEALFIPQA